MTLPPVLFPSRSGRAGQARTLIDYREWDGRRSMTNTGRAASGALYDLAFGAGVTTWFDVGANVGYVDAVGACCRIPVGAATTVGIGSTAWTALLQTDFSQFPATMNRYRRFTWRYVVELLGPCAAAEYWVGLHDVTNFGYLGTGGAGNIGVEFFFNPGAAQRWQVRSRRTKLGPLILGNAAGFGLGTRAELGLVYTEGLIPTLVMQVNGLPVETFRGLAQLPLSSPLPYVPAGGFPSSYGAAIGGTTFAGAAEGDLRVRHAQYLVEALE